MRIIPFPKNKQFAFTFTDDADDATTSKVRTIYDFLDSVDIKATKTVWVFESKHKSGNPEDTGKKCKGETLQNPEYLALIKNLQKRGHEIGLHLASGGNNLREETIEAYHFFKKKLGSYPKVNINHGRNADTLYWCKEVFKNSLFRFMAGLYSKDLSEGHIPESPYFWGDICKKYSKYMRLFKTLHLNTLAVNPSMPFYEHNKPFVPNWFTNTDLSTPWLIKRLVTSKNLENLKHDNGACIGYTYLHRFVEKDEKINELFVKNISILKTYTKNCWFVPVSYLLERLQQIQRLILIKIDNKYIITNYNQAAVNDVWIKGKPGERIYNENGYYNTFGASGIINIESIPVINTNNQIPNISQLKTIERLQLILGQIFLLLLHHLKSRKFKRIGW